MKNVIDHYDLLIDENNDPVRDPEPLKAYMDKWDGDDFINSMSLEENENVLEIGVGTGRLALKIAPLCKSLTGIDISPKTISRARENLSDYKNITLICDDFNTFLTAEKFDVIYSSLVFMHFEDKQTIINKVASLLKSGGRFVLSIDKNDSNMIDIGTRKVNIFPDNPDDIRDYLIKADLTLITQFETEFAFVFVSTLK